MSLPSIKLKPALETEVYISEGGYIAIKQPEGLAGEETVVCLTPDQALLVMREMGRMVEAKDCWWSTVEGEQGEKEKFRPVEV
jgi:hypothetical protein